MDMEQSLLEEKKAAKGGRLARCKTPLVCLAILVLAGLFAALTVLMINIEKGNQFIINSLLPSIRDPHVYPDYEYPEWGPLYPADDFPERLVWNPEGSSEKPGNADEMLGGETGLLWIEGPNGKEYADLKTQGQNKENSRRLCQKAGGFLSEPKSHEEFDFLKTMSNYSFYLGLNFRDYIKLYNQKYERLRNLTEPKETGQRCLINGRGNGWLEVECSDRVRTVICERQGKRLTTTKPYTSGSTTTRYELDTSTPESPGLIWKEGPNGKEYANLRKPDQNKENSRRLCQKAGGFLSEPKNHDEFDFLKTISSYKPFYLGLNFNEKQDSWVYDSDGTRFKLSNQKYARLRKLHGQSCLVDVGNGWIEVWCSLGTGTVICERRGKRSTTTKPYTSASTTTSHEQDPSTTESPASCPEGFTSQSDQCYQFIDSPKSWSEAAKHCRDLDSFLAEPRTWWQIRFLNRLSSKKSRNIWLGATDQAVEGKFVWAQSGEAVDDGPTDWSRGEPDDDRSMEDCLHVRHFELPGQWYDIPCYFQNAFVCQKSATNGDNSSASPDCAEGFWGKYCHLQDGCYYNGNRHGYLGSLAETSTGRTCMSWSLQTPHEHTFVASDFPDGNLDHNYCRAPQNDNEDNVPWCFTTNPRIRWEHCAVKNCACPVGYSGEYCNIKETQAPTAPASTKKTPSMDSAAAAIEAMGKLKVCRQCLIESGMQGKPEDEDIKSNKDGICDKIQMLKTCLEKVKDQCESNENYRELIGDINMTAKLCQDVKKEKSCAQGFRSINGYCYGLVKEKKSWEDAQASCITKGGFLAEPQSRQDSEGLRKFAMDNGAITPWIGGTFREGGWVWSHSGESVNYTDWYEGEPNNGLGNEFCLALNGWYRLNDAPCNWQEQYICQM